MYIPRMWFSENERKGFMTCAPFGYTLVGIAGWIGLIGWVLFLGLIAVFILGAAARLFQPPTLWTFALPFVLGVLAFFIDTIGRSFALRKQFQYCYTPDVSSWVEGDAVQTYPPGRDVKALAAERPNAP